MTLRCRAVLSWWDVTDLMTLVEVYEFCMANEVELQVDAGRLLVPVYVVEDLL